MAATKADRWVVARQARTLMEAHDALSRLMPEPSAEQSVWRDYYLRSAASSVPRSRRSTRGHHHEALYWSDRERRKGEEINSTTNSGNPVI